MLVFELTHSVCDITLYTLFTVFALLLQLTRCHDKRKRCVSLTVMPLTPLERVGLLRRSFGRATDPACEWAYMSDVSCADAALDTQTVSWDG